MAPPMANSPRSDKSKRSTAAHAGAASVSLPHPGWLRNRDTRHSAAQLKRFHDRVTSKSTVSPAAMPNSASGIASSAVHALPSFLLTTLALPFQVLSPSRLSSRAPLSLNAKR